MKDIAIIGISGRFPEANNLAEFRQNLMLGKDGVRAISFERKSATSLPLDKEYMGIGFMEDIDKFDHKFFNISKAEAENMDPHQRLMLEVVYEAIESAGYDMDFFNGTETAVFIGDTVQDYYRLAERFDPTLVTGTTSATTAGRISRFFNFRGSAAMVDTACSSSLVAVHMACNELAMGDADYALACGVRFILFPDEKNGTVDMGIMSADGKTRSFSANADGSGAGEAVGCILLKPLDKALADNDIIYAVIKGTAVNQDAQLSGSLTAPSSQAQSEVIKKVWKKSNVDPATISYIEAHGSGTKLGDPIEIAGIDLAFKRYTTAKHFCAVSSIKSNIGHTGGAAGISGLIKAVLSLQYKELYPAVHFDQPNPFIDFKNSVTYINTAYKTWNSSFPRRAGVSSFGLSGTNCHILLEEASLASTKNSDPGTFIFNFSAKSANSLDAYLKEFSAYLTQNNDLTLDNISCTLNHGRKHYQHRVSVIASSREQLIQKIKESTGSTTKQAVKKLIFLFSGDSIVSDQLLIGLSNNHPELKIPIDECIAYYTAPNAAVNRFVLQYALYRFLEKKGITTEHLLGIGTGDLVVAVILNELSLEDAIKQCTFEEPSAVDLHKRLTNLVERETDEGKVAFVELGTTGALSTGLMHLNYPDKEFLYSVIHMENSPLEIIQALYLQQFPISWATYYTQSNYAKVALPTYHFEKVRCWLKEPLKHDDFVLPIAANAEPVLEIAQEKGINTMKHHAIINESWSATEQTIAAIWIEALKLEELSLEDDFFKLGGHSLIATKVISIIEKEFGIRLVFKDIFTFATVKSLAKGVEELIANGTQKITYQDIQPAPAQPYYPLSEAQLRLWLIAQMSEDTIAYNLPTALMLEGSLDVDKLENAFRSLINRHESMRTSFHEENAQPVQVVQNEVSFSIQKINGSEDLDKTFSAFLQPFDLTQAPLLRIGLVTIAPDKYLLLLDIHHIISDGVSSAVITSELVTLYHGEELPELKIQYKDFVVWQQELFANGFMTKHEQFWLQQFSEGVPVLHLQTDKPRPATQSFNGDKLLFELSAGDVEKIQALSSSTGTTPFMFLLAVYNILLYKYTNQEDIVVGSPIAGRSHNGLDNVVGMFVNTLVLKNKLAKEKTFLQFLDEVKTVSLNAYEHQDYPFVLLVDKLNLKKDPSRNPLFDVMFVLQNIPASEIRLDKVTITDYPVSTGIAQFDLLMEINEGKGNWPVKIEYNTALFEAESILLMKERFLALLHNVFADPAKTIEEISIKIAADVVDEISDLDISFNF
jgi:3-oxoacyl-(acyl-carrier-protein) synthase/acyl carrier protein